MKTQNEVGLILRNFSPVDVITHPQKYSLTQQDLDNYGVVEKQVNNRVRVYYIQR